MIRWAFIIRETAILNTEKSQFGNVTRKMWVKGLPLFASCFPCKRRIRARDKYVLCKWGSKFIYETHTSMKLEADTQLVWIPSVTSQNALPVEEIKFVIRLLVSLIYTLEYLAISGHSANLNVLTIGSQGLYTSVSFQVPPLLPCRPWDPYKVLKFFFPS